MGMESVDHNEEFHFDDEKDGLELGDIPPQEILEDQKVI